MVKAQQELTQLEKDILVAQEKLQDINDAINRDQLTSEEKTKEAKKNTKEAEAIQVNLDQLTIDQETEKANLKALKEKQEAEIIKHNEKVSQLKIKIAEAEQKLLDLEAEQGDKRKLVDKEIKKLNNELEIANQDHVEAIKMLTDEEEEKSKEIISLMNTIVKQTEELNKSKQDVKDNEAKVILLNTSISEFEAKEKILKQYVIDQNIILSDIQEKVNKLKTDETALKNTNVNLIKQNEELAIEVEQKATEVDKFNKDKLQLQADKEALAGKEAFIKSKFEQAGIIYS